MKKTGDIKTSAVRIKMVYPKKRETRFITKPLVWASISCLHLMSYRKPNTSVTKKQHLSITTMPMKSSHNSAVPYP